MFTKRTFFVVLTVSALLLIVSIGTGANAIARSPSPALPGVTIPYSGRLSNAAGQPVADGVYDFTFALYDAETNGTRLWSETQRDVKVTTGTFAAPLGSVNPIPTAALDGGKRWLAVGVRGPGERDYTALTPRQALGVGSSPAPAAPAAGPSCPHDHLYEDWVGNNVAFALSIANGSTGHGIQVSTNATAWDRAALRAVAWSSGPGVFASSGTGNALLAQSGGGGGRDFATILAENTNTLSGMAANMKNNSALHTAHFYNAGSGGVLYLQNGGNAIGTGGDFITAVNKTEDDPQFRVTTTGAVMSDFGYTTPAVDFAEMLQAAEGLQAGDVLIIGADGKLSRSTEPYQTSVAGVYSTQPGFLGGHPVSGPVAGTIPLALVGVVPVKVSAENGAIRPGDLLVAGSIPGHAMKAGANPPQGAVIGKAMEKLDAGTGVIKMLATLQ